MEGVMLLMTMVLSFATLIQSQTAPNQSEQKQASSNLSGLWMDGQQYVLLTQSGSSVTATYVEDYLCFEGTLKGAELQGATSVCEWEQVHKLYTPGYVFKSGLRMERIHLNISPERLTLAGTYLNILENKEYPVRMVRKDKAEEQLHLADRLLSEVVHASEVERACEAAGPDNASKENDPELGYKAAQAVRACMDLDNWDELLEKRAQANTLINAVWEADQANAKAQELWERSAHAGRSEAQTTLRHLSALVKTGGPRLEVEALDTRLRELAQQLAEEREVEPEEAERYQQRAALLWAVYAKTLAKVRDVCPGCPTLELTTLANEYGHPRLLGTGDYSRDELAWMKADPDSKKPAYAPLVTGDFSQDGATDVALIGRGQQKGKASLFLLIASVQNGVYIRLFLQPVEWDKAALTVADGTLILRETLSTGDDYWTLAWDGTTFASRYAGEELGSDGEKEPMSSRRCKLVTRGKDFALQFVSNGKEKQVAIPRAWLVPPAAEKAEKEDFASSFQYTTQVTSFPIGNGRIGLHLSSYDWMHDHGSAHAAAGRDVFLIYDPKSSTLARGNLHLGITKQRLRDSGCWTAEMAHFLLADVNHDGLTDIGVIKENMFCYPDELGGEFYQQHTVRWYVYTPAGWNEDVHFSGRLPQTYSELPQLGTVWIEAGMLDNVAGLFWPSHDPANWRSRKGQTPKFVPAYRRELMRSEEGK